MATKAKLQELVIAMQVETAELRKGLDKANRQLDGFAKKADSAGKLVAAAFSADLLKDALVGVTNFVRQGAEAADSMGDLAESVGVPVEALSALGYAAGFAGVSTEQVGLGLGKLAKQMNEAAKGTKKQSELFASLGIAVTDSSGQLRASDEVFGDLADRFAGMTNGAEKAAVAQEIFGESGVKLVPVLNQGRDGIKEMTDEAERFGLIVTAEGAAAAGRFSDAIDKVAKVGEGLAIRVAQDLAPSMSALADELLGAATQGDGLKGTAEVLATGLRLLASTGSIVASTFDIVGTTLAGVASAVVNAVTGDFDAAGESLSGLKDELAKSGREMAERLEAIWSKKPPEGPGDYMEKQAEKVARASDSMLTKLQKLKEKAKKDLADATRQELQDELDAVMENVGRGARVDFSDQLAELASGRQSGVVTAAVAARDAIAARPTALQNAAGAIGNAAMGGSLGRVVQGGMQGGFIGAGAALLMESKQFAEALEALDGVVLAAADTVGIVIEPLIPLFEALGSVVGELSPVFEFIGGVIGEVAKAVAGVWNGLMTLLDAVLGWTGMADFKAMMIDVNHLGKKSREASEPLDHAGDAAGKLAEQLGTAAAGLPAFYRLNLPRFQSILPEGMGAGGGGGVGADDLTHGGRERTSPITIGSITIKTERLVTEDELGNLIDRLGRKQGRLRDGGVGALPPRF